MASYLNGGIALFDVQTGLPLHSDERTPKGEPLATAWSPSGDQVVTGHDDGVVRLWDAKTGNLLWHRLLAPVSNPRGKIASPSFVTFSHDGRRIVVGGARDQSNVTEPNAIVQPGIPAVYETDHLEMSGFYPRYVHLAALSSDGKIIVVAPPDPGIGPSPNAAELRGIDLTTGKTLWTSQPGERPAGLSRLAQRDVKAMCFQPASNEVEIALVTGEVVRLDALTGKERRRFLTDWRSPEKRQLPTSPWPAMWQAVFSADARTLGSATDEFVYVWDVNAGKLRR